MNVMIRKNCREQLLPTVGDVVAILAPPIKNLWFDAKPPLIHQRFKSPVEHATAKACALPQLRAGVKETRAPQHNCADPALCVVHASGLPGVDVVVDHLLSPVRSAYPYNARGVPLAE